MSESMQEIARLIRTHDVDLRKALETSRSGLFRDGEGQIYLRSNVPLGQKYSDEVIGIFADTADLDFFYRVYLQEEA